MADVPIVGARLDEYLKAVFPAPAAKDDERAYDLAITMGKQWRN